MATPPRKTYQQGLLIVCLACAYFFAARLGLSLATAPRQVTAVWPPAGVGVAALIVFGMNAWPGVAIGAFFANAFANEPTTTAMLIALGNTVESVSAAWLLRRWAFVPSLERMRDVVLLLGPAAAVSAAAAATIGVLSLWLGGLVASANIGHVWYLWWLGDGTGIGIFAPLLLTWTCREPVPLPRKRVLEVLIFLATVAATSVFIFVADSGAAQYKFLLFPFFVWSAYRLGQRYTAAAGLCVCVIAVWGQLHASAAAESLNDRLQMIQAFNGILALTGLCLGALIIERRKLEMDLEASQSGLEQRVIEKTADLRTAESRLKLAYSDLETRVQERTADLSRATENLRRSEQWLQAIIDNSNAIVQVKDLDGRYLLVNREWEKVNRMSREQVIGRTMFDIYPRDVASRLGENDKQVAASPDAFQFEERVEHPEGPRTYISNKFALRDSKGAAYAICGIATDITAREQQEQREKRAKEMAEAANRSKDEFLAVLSHELRTPLTPMLGWTRMLRSGTLPAADVAKGLETIERNVKAQCQLIEDLLDISRIITGKLIVERQPMQLGEVVLAAVDTVKPAADAKGLELRLDVERTAGLISGDPRRLQQVAWNLLSNAVKFTPSGGQIRVSLRTTTDHVEFEVADNGEGISPDFLPHMFNRFSQADSTTTRQHGGLGLGLAIVKNIVQFHGGSVSVASPGKGAGSTFTVRLPLIHATESAQMAGVQNDAPEAKQSFQNLRGLKVLAVDDQKDSRDFVVIALQQWGAEVASADSAESALAAIRRSAPDVVLCDIGMPGQDGYDLARRLHEETGNRPGRLPIIALTAYARAEDETKILDAGFERHLPKPVDPFMLAATVSAVAAKHSSNV